MYQILLTLPQERTAGAATGAAVLVNAARARNANVLGWFQGPYRLSDIPQHLIAQVQAVQQGNGTEPPPPSRPR